MLLMMLAGGFYVKTFPPWIEWIKYSSFVFYSYRLLMKLEFSERAVFDCGNIGVNKIELDSEIECVQVTNIQDALSLPFSVDDSIATDVLILMGILISFRLGLYFILKHKTQS